MQHGTTVTEDGFQPTVSYSQQRSDDYNFYSFMGNAYVYIYMARPIWTGATENAGVENAARA